MESGKFMEINSILETLPSGGKNEHLKSGFLKELLFFFFLKEFLSKNFKLLLFILGLIMETLFRLSLFHD